MLIHFCPRLLTPAGFDLPCELIDIRIKEFDLHLLGGRDVVARHDGSSAESVDDECERLLELMG